ncbi:MAG: MerR family transcriptional regulator [Actinomycetota bacterium]|nr:MerR family transcriptional regulator [Actinomycetota bacterium]
MNASSELERVGEIAERLGVSPRTIKYYEELGLIRPETRSPGGFRLYGKEGAEQLERILRMKSIGYSLAAIRELLATRDAAQEADKITVISNTVERLQDREREVTERIQQMRKDLKQAEALREELGHDIALCQRRIQELGGQAVREERGT